MTSTARLWLGVALLVCGGVGGFEASVTGPGWAAGVAAAERLPLFGATEGGLSVLLSGAEARGVYGGIMRYEGRARCTGVLADSGKADSAASPAYVLTSGHCPDFPGTNEVLVDRPGRGRVVFDYFIDSPTSRRAVNVRRVAYASMKGADLAVLELDVTLAALEAEGIRPWPLASMAPFEREAVAVLGAPLLGADAVRLAACALEGTAPRVLEFQWHWFDQQRLRCADVGPGSSGGPVISRTTGRVIGLVGTTTRGAAPLTDCGIDHPCEPEPGGARGRPDMSYATSVVGLGRCFSDDGFFALGRTGCPLDQGDQPRVQPNRLGSVNPAGTPVFGPSRARWDVAVAGAFDLVRYKVVAAAHDDCRSPSGYSVPARFQSPWLIDDPLPHDDGYYYLCVVAGRSRASSVEWQPFESATIASVLVDTLAPRVPASATIAEQPNGWRVTFGPSNNEVATVLYKVGRTGETLCVDLAGYRPALIAFISVPRAPTPLTLCLMPADAAGNRGPTSEFLLP